MKKAKPVEAGQTGISYSVQSCPVCGSRMIKVSENPDVWLCPKCGFKTVSEPGKK